MLGWKIDGLVEDSSLESRVKEGGQKSDDIAFSMLTLRENVSSGARKAQVRCTNSSPHGRVKRSIRGGAGSNFSLIFTFH